jgi:hydrogenase maturation protein HypF
MQETLAAPAIAIPEPQRRLRVTVRGAVQGVGFRPFVYRLATGMGLAGWVNNSPQGVQIEVEGDLAQLHEFLLRVEAERPPRSSIQGIESTLLDPAGYQGFAVRPSDAAGAKSVLVPPDIATCPDCLREIFDRSNRRYRYPFTNCTNCGPRYSIVEALPYDRASTTMRGFAMCPECLAEYHDPRDRRFHAQPNACPRCGPRLALWDPSGHARSCEDEALREAADAIRCGAIVAVKGLGGFHLVVDARSQAAVARLRRHKAREEKPFAVMFPSVATLRWECELTPPEERLLRSPEAPIVLLQRSWPPASPWTTIAEAVAPGNPTLGAMLPYTPLHHLLMAELGVPLVATSGNRSDEPICTDEHEALERLAGIADLLLVHNRPIARHVDDSVARVALGRELLLRRARGYAPLPIHAGDPDAPRVLAAGAHQKNTVAIGGAGQVFLSQHIGDLETPQALAAAGRAADGLASLYEWRPALVACDAHPDYRSTRYAEQLAEANDLPLARVQHHYAHVLACMAENELDGPALGVAWDGTGYGLDGTIWGGEFLHVGERGFERAAHLRPFRLPGGEAAVREPWRAALGLLYELEGGAAIARDDLAPLRGCSERERAVLRAMLERGLNAPWTSSAGRLFDAVAALVGLRRETRFEGQAAMELEWALDERAPYNPYPFRLTERAGALVVDWEPMALAIVAGLREGAPAGAIAARFHDTLAAMIVAVAEQVGEPRVALTGGCFQNIALLGRAVAGLEAAGFRTYWHQRVPPNDGGIALGQAVAAMRGARRGG